MSVQLSKTLVDGFIRFIFKHYFKAGFYLKMSGKSDFFNFLWNWQVQLLNFRLA